MCDVRRINSCDVAAAPGANPLTQVWGHPPRVSLSFTSVRWRLSAEIPEDIEGGAHRCPEALLEPLEPTHQPLPICTAVSRLG